MVLIISFSFEVNEINLQVEDFMEKNIKSDKSNSFYDDKTIPELGAQPRKSDARVRKYTKDIGGYSDEDDGKSGHSHRTEPNKNLVRAQLRRIERLY